MMSQYECTWFGTSYIHKENINLENKKKQTENMFSLY